MPYKPQRPKITEEDIPSKISPVVDAEKAQIDALLAQGREYQRTGDPKSFSRVVREGK